MTKTSGLDKLKETDNQKKNYQESDYHLFKNRKSIYEHGLLTGRI